MRVALVLRSGGDFEPGHVETLARQIHSHLSGAKIICLADCEVACEPVSLRHDWPGWWAKMELYAPWIEGDLLYVDLDTVITGDLADIAGRGKLTVLSDFYRPERMGSGLMYLPHDDRAAIWEAWIADPERHIAECTTPERWGDQGFLQDFWRERADRWQDVLPGQVVSYKVHVREPQTHRESGNGSVPDNARVVAFHGKPRPWETDLGKA